MRLEFCPMREEMKEHPIYNCNNQLYEEFEAGLYCGEFEQTQRLSPVILNKYCDPDRFEAEIRRVRKESAVEKTMRLEEV